MDIEADLIAAREEAQQRMSAADARWGTSQKLVPAIICTNTTSERAFNSTHTHVRLTYGCCCTEQQKLGPV